MLMIEMVSRADPSLMTLFGYQDVGELIARFGDEALREKYLPGLSSGEYIGAIVLTEPGAGSDLQSIKVRAEQNENGDWLLNGIKHFISNGCGDVLMVLAKTEPGDRNIFGLSLFACPASDSVVINRVEEKMGLHGSPTCELSFQNAPAELVGSRRVGLTKYVLESLNQARFSVAAQAIGIAEAAYQQAFDYAGIRSQFGRLINSFPAVANLLLEMQVDIESSRALVYDAVQWLDLKVGLEERVAHLKGAGLGCTAERTELVTATRKVNLLSPMVKYVATEAANRVCYNAQQIFGGMGYMRETGVEQLVRDVRITSIYEGTSQVQVAASLKSVMADILADDIEAWIKELMQSSLRPESEKLEEIRNWFERSRQYLLNKNDTAYSDAAAKDMVDVYASMSAASLLLKQSLEFPDKDRVARRYLNCAGINAAAAFSRISSDYYNDLAR
jgi:alkylation response protein AidB-like acyl-CoA dehydrogenase